MSDSDKQSDLPQSGLAWITLAASTTGLLVLCVWALLNQDTLFNHGPQTPQTAIADQSEAESPLSENENTDTSSTSTDNIADVATKPSTESVAQSDEPTDNMAQKPAAANAPLDEQLSEVELIEDIEDDVQVPAEIEPSKDEAQNLTDNEPGVEDATNLATEKLAAIPVESDQLATEQEYAQKLAAEKIAVDEALADQAVAGEKAAEQKAAEEKAAEEKAAEEKAAEEKAAEEKAAEEKAAEEKAAEEKAAEEKAAEEKAAEEKAAEEKAAEEKAAEEKAAEEKAAEEKAAEEKAAEEKAAEEKAAEEKERELKLAAEKQQVELLAALPERAIPMVDAVDEPTQAASENESAFEKSRREDLAQLSEFATLVRFKLNGIEAIDDSKQPMDRMFELLFLYSETTVTVQVASNEYEIDENNRFISRERALVIINYLIDRGLDEQRFRIRALGKQELPIDSHQVTVVATVIDK